MTGGAFYTGCKNITEGGQGLRTEKKGYQYDLSPWAAVDIMAVLWSLSAKIQISIQK